MGFYVQAEYRTSRGRIDLLIGTDKYIYIIELKFEGSAQDAMQQIHARDYALPFAADGREIIRIGANVSKETRNIEEWVVTRWAMSDERWAISEYSEYRDAINDERLETGEWFSLCQQIAQETVFSHAKTQSNAKRFY